MKKTNSRCIFVRSITIFISFAAIFIGCSSTISAQELDKTNQKIRTLREIAQERDVEIGQRTCGTEWEYDLEKHKNSEAIVQGRIIKIETTLETYSLYTTYTIETQRIIKPFTSNVPLEAYLVLNRPLPESIGAIFKISRAGGLLFVNGHRIREKVAGYDELVENKNYIFFLMWSSDYKTYTLAGGISGVVLVQDDLQIKSLAADDKVKELNENFLKENRNLEDFLEKLKKE